MVQTMTQAVLIVKKNLNNCKIISGINFEDKYLFIAHRSDPVEGNFMPFFSVDKKTGNFRDFSPQEFPNPLEIITLLDNAATN